MTNDESQLDVLSVFHFVLGGLTGLFACIPLVHVAIGIALLAGSFDGEPPPPVLGWMFIVIGGVVVLLGWTMAVLMITAGKRLKRRTSHTYCLVIGALECLIVPFGTVLGVFTLVLLSKDSVKQLFASGRSRTAES